MEMPQENPTQPPDARTAALLTQADALCARRGTRLTDLRREVLSLILAAGQPMGAYALLEQMRATRRATAPPTVYRALEFLQEQGLIHKIERLSAFIPCIESPDHSHDHQAQFLICQSCGQVTEIDDHALVDALAAAAARAGFALSGATVEAEGVCGVCRAG
jgi:Fur family zinc uptake transcriptional regulator